MKAIAFAVLLALACPLLATAETTEIELPADPAIYGEFPKAYQEIITKWLETKLADAPSAQIVWVTTPVAGNLPGPGGKPLFGYLVEFKVNARNRFGTYTGMQKHRALIRNGAVIKGTGFGF
jgi:hypothetical protein